MGPRQERRHKCGWWDERWLRNIQALKSLWAGCKSSLYDVLLLRLHCLYYGRFWWAAVGVGSSFQHIAIFLESFCRHWIGQISALQLYADSKDPFDTFCLLDPGQAISSLFALRSGCVDLLFFSSQSLGNRLRWKTFECETCPTDICSVPHVHRCMCIWSHPGRTAGRLFRFSVSYTNSQAMNPGNLCCFQHESPRYGGRIEMGDFRLFRCHITSYRRLRCTDRVIECCICSTVDLISGIFKVENKPII